MSTALKSPGISNHAEPIGWSNVFVELDAQGWGILPKLLSAQECDAIADLYNKREGFRSQVVMARHGFGRGEYRYFAYPLPSLIEELRTTLYPHLVPIANRWHETMGINVRFPADHVAFIERCHAAGQTRPTPLVFSPSARTAILLVFRRL
jgi:uncharacterized protein